MGRLIDADKFKQQIAGMAITHNYPTEKVNALCELIDAQPTVYDVDAVVEQLKKVRRENTAIALNKFQEENCFWYGQGMDKAIKIVKNGVNITEENELEQEDDLER